MRFGWTIRFGQYVRRDLESIIHIYWSGIPMGLGAAVTRVRLR